MPEAKTLIDASEAAKSAAAYLNAMMPQAQNVLLEEVEKDTDQNRPYWLITLSFQLPPSGLAFLGKKEYKIFKIDASSGEVITMKIKTL